MKKGQIVLIPFPFSDLSSQKLRPALVLCHEKNNEDMIICAISSQNIGKNISLNVSDLSSGILPKQSYIRFQKIITIDSSLIQKIVAEVSEKKLKEVLTKVRELF